MKRAILISALMLVFVCQSRAQFEKGQSEISFLGSMGAASATQNTGGIYPFTSSITQWYLSFATTYDYYLVNGFSLEPEVVLDWIERSSPAVFLLANVSYTHLLSHSNVAVFGRIGYGISNGFTSPIYAGALFKVMDAIKIGVFNVGAGTKILVSKNVIVRTELNYQSQSWTENDYGIIRDEKLSNLGIFTGISFLF